MGTIELEGMEFTAYHGCLESERRDGNLFVVDFSAEYDIRDAVVTDRLEDTLDYGAVYEIIAKEMTVPESLRPTLPGWRSPLCEDVVTRKHKVFPIHHGNGNKYINMDVLRSISKQQSEISKKNYRNLNRKKKK